MARPLRIKQGQRFGLLVILTRAESTKAGKAKFNCLCDCGETHVAVASGLVSGHTTSCGCYRRRNNLIAGHKTPGQAAYSTLYSSCRGGARSRNLAFEITKEQHRQLIAQECYYCGKPPRDFNPYVGSQSTMKRVATQESIDRSWVKANGIDRKNNMVGYIPSNCVPCCAECNEGKSDRDVQDFIDRAYRIVALDKVRRAK